MNVAVMIPCYNERETIAGVVGDFRRQLPQARIVVFDNGSTDDSASLAGDAGAEVIAVLRRGKGFLMQRMFELVRADVYVLVDGDGTYDAAGVHELLRLVEQGTADMAVGRRQPLTPAAMKPMNKLGNFFFSRLMSMYFNVNLDDILSGFRVVNREFGEQIPILSFEFEVEAEITLQALSREMRIKEVPVGYRPRPAGSKSKLRVFKDGYMVLSTVVALFRDLRPLTFFGLIAAALWLGALTYGIHVYAAERLAGLFDVIVLTSVFIIGWLFLLIGFALHTINRRFAEMVSVLRRMR